LKRGELYRVYKGNKLDPKEHRVFAVVSRQVVIDSAFSTLICAPVYSRWDELSTQIPIGTEAGLKHDSAIHCDELVSLPKSMLTNFVGELSRTQLDELADALRIALDVEG
jgi:mRNA interferase MazF